MLITKSRRNCNKQNESKSRVIMVESRSLLKINSPLQIIGLKMCRTEQLEDGEWIEDHDQIMQLKANFIISAFGSGLYDNDGKARFYLVNSLLLEPNLKR